MARRLVPIGLVIAAAAADGAGAHGLAFYALLLAVPAAAGAALEALRRARDGAGERSGGCGGGGRRGGARRWRPPAGCAGARTSFCGGRSGRSCAGWSWSAPRGAPPP